MVVVVFVGKAEVGVVDWVFSCSSRSRECLRLCRAVLRCIVMRKKHSVQSE